MSLLNWMRVEIAEKTHQFDEYYVYKVVLDNLCKETKKRKCIMKQDLLFFTVRNIANGILGKEPEITDQKLVKRTQLTGIFDAMIWDFGVDVDHNEVYYLKVYEKIKSAVCFYYEDKILAEKVAKSIFDVKYPFTYHDPGLMELKIFFDEYQEYEMFLKFTLPNAISTDVRSVLQELELDPLYYEHMIKTFGEKGILKIIIKSLQTVDDAYKTCGITEHEQMTVFCAKLEYCGHALRQYLFEARVYFDNGFIVNCVKKICMSYYDKDKDGEYIWDPKHV